MTGRPPTGTHGQYGYARYHKCKCDPCHDAIRAYAKRLEYDHARGIRRRVPAEPVRQHVQYLMDLGATLGQIHKGTGGAVHRSQILRLMHGDARSKRPATYLFREAATALMALRPLDVLNEERLVDATGMHRRIQALNRMGFTCENIGKRLGFTGGSHVYHYLQRQQVMVSSVQKVAALYDELAGIDGPHEAIRWKGIRLGWPPPMAWDDHTIDDPQAEPNWEWVRCAGPECTAHVYRMGLCHRHYNKIRSMGRLEPPVSFRNAVLRYCKRTNFSRRNLADDVAELRELGFTLDGAAARLGKKRSVVEAAWY